MTPRKQALLDLGLLLLAVILTFVVGVTRDVMTPEQVARRTEHLFPQFEKTEVTRLEYEGGGQSFALERKESTAEEESASWRFVLPFEEQAETHAVSALLSRLELLTVLRRIGPDDVDEAVTGFGAPTGRLKLHMGSKTYELALGKDALGTEAGVYVTLREDALPVASGVISKALATELVLHPTDFREVRLLTLSLPDIGKIELSRQDGVHLLTRLPAGGFALGPNGRVDRAWLERLHAGLAAPPKERFLGTPSAPGALGDTLRVRFFPTDSARPPVTIVLGGPCREAGSVLAEREGSPPLVTCVPEELLRTSARDLRALLDTRLVYARADEIETLEVKNAEQALKLSRREGAFDLVVRRNAREHGDLDAGVAAAPEKPTSVELEIGNPLLERLVRIRGERLDQASPPPGGTGMRVHLGTVAADGTEGAEEELRVWPGVQGAASVERVADGARFRVPPGALANLLPTGAAFRSREVLSFEPASLFAFELRSASIVQRVTRTGPGTYRLELPSGFEHDGTLVAHVVQTLGTLEAERWVTDKDDGSFGFAKPALTATLELDPKKHAERLALTIGDRTADGSYATLNDGRGVFVLSRRTVEVLDTILLDRGAVAAEPERVRSLRLTTRQRHYSVERIGDDWTHESDEALSASAIQIVLDTLSTLRVEGTAHLGKALPEEGMERPLLTMSISLDRAQGEPQSKTFQVGTGDVWRGLSVHYVRVVGVDATYVVARSLLSPLFEVAGL